MARSILLFETLLFGGLLHSVVYCQSPDETTRRLCNAQVMCSDCISANPGCVWCADQDYNSTRCYAAGDAQFQSCSEGKQQNPRGSVNNVENVTLGNSNQLSPIRAAVSVRPGEPQTFQLNVRPASNFPLDVYLLMDLSGSMNDDLDNLKRLGSQLANSIRSLSSDFTIGFGSFIEKRVSPFSPNNLARNPRYTYRHTISLTNDSDRFDRLLQLESTSGNQDFPEDGFDGFMQAMLCTELIGWRTLSRKILVYITDENTHIAGDGKLGGIILPYQSVCRLPQAIPPDESYVEYSRFDSELYDYPSVGQIAQTLREKEIIPVFAAVRSFRSIYESLALELGEGAATGVLDTDSGNVVRLVEELYNTVSQRVIFKQEQIPGISITVNPITCPEGSIKDGICSDLQIGRNAKFNVSVSVTECTQELLDSERNVSVRVVGFGSFVVGVRALCQCPCEETQEQNSTFCNRNGTLNCGQCDCEPGRFGMFCQCDASNQGAQLLDCPVGNNNVQCTGRGTCVCGICNCQPGFSGTACECDENDCINEDNGLLCSGRGTCGCDGRCTCNIEPVSQLPYREDLCECTPNTQNCRDPSNSTSICNGRGMCGCNGNCECEDPYFGQFCEPCSGSNICFDNNCDSNRDCANCAINIIANAADTISSTDFFTNKVVDSELLPMGSRLMFDMDTNASLVTLPMSHCSACENGAVIISGTEMADYEINGEMALRCEEMRDNCIYRYFVAINPDTNEFTSVHVEYRRVCISRLQSDDSSISVSVLWIIAAAILLALLGLGLLILALLKGILIMLYRVELKKFEKEVEGRQFNQKENPLYQGATKNYENPAYNIS